MKKLSLLIVAIIFYASCSPTNYIEDKKVTIKRVYPITLNITLGEFANFDSDKSILLNQDIPRLNEFIHEIKNLKGKITIEGHTDTTNTDEYNMALSLRRAQSAKDYIAQRLDINNFQVELKPYGKSKPIYQNEKNQEEKAKNRRVIISFEETEQTTITN